MGKTIDNSVKDVTLDKEVINNNLFMAVANCDIAINLNAFQTIRAFNKTRLIELNEINGMNMTQLPDSATLANFSRGEKIQFGDEVEFGDRGNITVYPKFLFNEYNSRTIELPTPVSGRLDELFKNLGGLPDEERKRIVDKNELLSTNRFFTVPLIERID